MTFFGEFYCEREWRGSAATRAASLPASGGIEVVIIEIEMDSILRRGLIAP